MEQSVVCVGFSCFAAEPNTFQAAQRLGQLLEESRPTNHRARPSCSGGGCAFHTPSSTSPRLVVPLAGKKIIKIVQIRES